MAKKTLLQFRAEDELAEVIDQRARHLGLTRSGLMSFAIVRYLRDAGLWPPKPDNTQEAEKKAA